MNETMITIYGASDDLVEVEGKIEGADEYSTGGHWSGVIEAPDGATAIVYVDYRDNGTWTTTIGQYEEDYPLPEWTAATAVEPGGYSTTLSLIVPEGSKITETP
jgi:hypothetical protein